MNKKKMSKIMLVSSLVLSTSNVFASNISMYSPYQFSTIGINNYGAAVKQGKIYTWGNNEKRQMGKRTEETIILEPMVLDAIPEPVISVEVGNEMGAALTESGKVYTWGKNNRRTTGHSNTNAANSSALYSPYQLINLPKIVSIDASYNHMVAVAENGEVYGWGLNDCYQVGPSSGEIYNDLSTVSSPRKIDGLSNIVYAAVGYSHSLFIDDKGDVYGLGNNVFSQLGNALPLTNIDVPTKIDGLSNITSIAAGRYFSFFLNGGGECFVLGSGPLGNGLPDNSIYGIPTKIEGLPTIKAIGAGGKSQSLGAISSGGDLYVWGNNSFGQLGLGNKNDQFTPLMIAQNVLEIEFSDQNMMFLKEDGTMWGAGTNTSNQLGEGDGLTLKQITFSNLSEVGNGIHSIDGVRDSIVGLEGKANATLISAEVPLSVSFSINPNADIREEVFISPSITVRNLTPAPIDVFVESFKKSSNNAPAIISQDTYTDESWSKLGIKDTHSKISLGLKNNNFDLFFEPESSQSPILLKDNLLFNDELSFDLQAKHGLSWSEAQEFSYDLHLKLVLNQ